MTNMTQLCLFCRGEGIYCLEREGDLATYVDCAYCDALDDSLEEYPEDEKHDRKEEWPYE